MRWVIPVAVLALFLTGCASSAAPSEPFVQGPLKEFDMTAKQFAFEPALITVNKGDHVKLHITSADVMHGISIPEFHVNAPLQLGHTSIVEFDATKVGLFQFRCSVFCGDGHSDMIGAVQVKEVTP
jgi:cytochrome c oxidase subunit 2